MGFKRFLFLFLFVTTFPLVSQVKIGDNPQDINVNSILELEASGDAKVLVLPRLTTTEINNIVDPLHGSVVYNSETNCIYMYRVEATVSEWKNLCDAGVEVTTSGTAPTNNKDGDIWIDDTNNNLVSVWDGTQWIAVNANPRRGDGAPTATTGITAGDIYVDTTTGNIYTFDGTNWVNQSVILNANNGLSVQGQNIQLGGNLVQATEITTTNINTLAIQGLQNGDVVTDDDLVVVDRTTGILKKAPASSILREEISTITANDGDFSFNTPLPITDLRKVNLYRNGVRIDFEVDPVNPTTTIIITDPESICFAGDEIRIVQFY